MREIFLGSIALAVKQHRAELERRVVSDAEFPIVGDPAGGVLQITLRDG
jgi:hypothetical protein